MARVCAEYSAPTTLNKARETPLRPVTQMGELLRTHKLFCDVSPALITEPQGRFLMRKMIDADAVKSIGRQIGMKCKRSPNIINSPVTKSAEAVAEYSRNYAGRWEASSGRAGKEEVR